MPDSFVVAPVVPNPIRNSVMAMVLIEPSIQVPGSGGFDPAFASGFLRFVVVGQLFRPPRS
jgi:hypothetical protein